MFECVEVFHNRQRRHSSIGMLIPIEYEKIHHTKRHDRLKHPDRSEPGAHQSLQQPGGDSGGLWRQTQPVSASTESMS